MTHNCKISNEKFFNEKDDYIASIEYDIENFYKISQYGHLIYISTYRNILGKKTK